MNIEKADDIDSCISFTSWLISLDGSEVVSSDVCSSSFLVGGERVGVSN